MMLTAELKYLKWQDLYEKERPFQLFIDLPPDAEDRRVSNLVFERHKVPIVDIRSHHDEFSLDTHGFMIHRHRTSFENFKDREAVASLYLPEVEEILRSNLDGVDGCFVFNWRLRNTEPELPGEIDLNDPTDFRRPATHLHVDQSSASVLNRIKLQFPEKADQLLQGRVRVVNVWRPLVNEISDWPLALCDGRTVDPGDLVETDHIQRKYTGPTMYMMHNPKHKFYFYGGQGKEDVLIFKNFDSLDGVCPYAPHAAFRDPVLRPRGEPRESIEVRCLVFTDPKALGAGC